MLGTETRRTQVWGSQKEMSLMEGKQGQNARRILFRLLINISRMFHHVPDIIIDARTEPNRQNHHLHRFCCLLGIDGQQ